MSRGMLTIPGGPVVISEKTLRALCAIRRQKYLPQLYGQVVIAQSSFEAMRDTYPSPDAAPAWLIIHDDQAQSELPRRITSMANRDHGDEAAVQLALALSASLVLLEEPIKEKAKLSFIKSEGTLAILVMAYREGWLSAVQPMVKALRSLGHGDVLPDEEQLAALWQALEQLE